MTDLPQVRKRAFISKCKRYRYWLSRDWNDYKLRATFIMLNPSTADAKVDDPTIRRCVSFARSWDCGGICVLNLFAIRSADPKVLRFDKECVGERNNEFLKQTSREGIVVVGWGASVPKRLKRRIPIVLRMLHRRGIVPKCLGLTANGSPRHPLFVPNGTPLQEFNPEGV